jgi:hypothetical protein
MLAHVPALVIGAWILVLGSAARALIAERAKKRTVRNVRARNFSRVGAMGLVQGYVETGS